MIMTRHVRRAALVLLTVIMMLGATPASAHTNPVKESTPRSGSVVTDLDEIMITFTDGIRPDFSTFTLRSADGVDHPLGVPQLSDGNAVVRLEPANALPDGLYRLGYQTVFDDGHSAAGVVQFEISADGTARAGEWPADDDAGPTRPEPERLDVTGMVPWLIGGAVVLAVVFVVIMLKVRGSGENQESTR